MIFWEGTWYPICRFGFTENTYGADLFCHKIGFPLGSVLLSPNKNEKFKKLPQFRLGKCLKNDVWPNCSGGYCNDFIVGGCCGNKTDIQTVCKSSCDPVNATFLNITCRGTEIGTLYSSCKGTAISKYSNGTYKLKIILYFYIILKQLCIFLFCELQSLNHVLKTSFCAKTKQSVSEEFRSAMVWMIVGT